MRDVDIMQAQADADGTYLARQVRAHRTASDSRREEIIDGASCDIGFTREQFLQAVKDDAERREAAATRSMIADMEMDGLL